MQKDIEHRAVEISRYFVENRSTVRQTAKVFHISKSTVHKDISERIHKVDPSLGYEVQQILLDNKMMRHIRGGEATKAKYAKMKRE